jgi:non-canonical (house-cleaning) NTP pyrophosphatase
MAKRINRAIEYVVVYKPDGVIIEFDRNSKGDPKPYHTMQSAVKRVKELRNGLLHSEHWVALTTWKLAEQHQIRL